MNSLVTTIGIILLGLAASLSLAADRYVSLSGSASSGYTNWAIAATSINQAVASAGVGETVWVTNGIYTNWATISISAITLKSVNGAEGAIIDGNYPAITQRCVSLNNINAVLDGFTLRNGCAEGGQGGGIYFGSQGGTVRNCTIISNSCGNSSGYGGGGVFIYATGLVENCFITENRDGGGYGGGVYFRNTCGTNALLVNCTISKNTSTRSCGGVFFFRSQGIVRSCLIVDNYTTNGSGGGVYMMDGGMLQNCTIVSNYSSSAGGGIVATTTASGVPGTAVVVNTIIYTNWHGAGGNAYNVNNSPLAIYSNCCLYPALSGESATYSTNVTTNNPQFTDLTTGNYRLLKESPCINAGTNQPWMQGALDLDRHSRIDKCSWLVDMGCYEHIYSLTIFVAH